MAKRRKKRRKNPSTAQWAVLGVGGVLGLGLLGYGLYLRRKSPSNGLPPEGQGGGVFPEGEPGFEIYRYSVIGSGDRWFARIQPPYGRSRQLGPYATRASAMSAAVSSIRALGGIPQAAA